MMKKYLVVILLSLFVAIPLSAREEYIIEDFDYSDESEAKATWIPGEGSLPAVPSVREEGGNVLRIPAPFSTGLPRTIHDRAVKLDLNQYGQFTLDVLVENPDAFAQFTLYFHSGDGWYGTSEDLSQSGWNRLKFHKAAFRLEGHPAGWNAITGIRLSAWAGAPINSAITVDRLAAVQNDIAIILPTNLEETNPGEAKSAREAANLIATIMEEIGLETDALEDKAILAGELSEKKLAILPLNSNLPQDVAEALRKFVDSGGKIFVTYSLDEPIAQLLGLRRTGWIRQERNGQFAKIRLNAPAVAGLPAGVKQASWNITLAESVETHAHVIGHWLDDTGADTGYPALYLSKTGAFLSHIVLSDDLVGKQRLLAAVLGHLVPGFWQNIAEHAISRAESVGYLSDFASVETFIKTANQAEALTALTKAVDLREQARLHYSARKFVTAFEKAQAAHETLSDAYLLSQPSPTIEGRAVWNHSGAGIYPGDWERSARELSTAGFNIIIPNMLWAGVAHYPSEVLPHSETFERYGDQIAQCVEAAHRYGLEVHVWKVNWNLSNAPEDFIQKMRKAGRTQVSPTGEPIDWLCPSHPDNFRLELDSLLEIVRKYEVDGLHFDYIRYPGPEGCYCDGCRERFSHDTGKTVKDWPSEVITGPRREEYIDWRCEQITRLVRAVHEQARKLRKGLKLSAAVFSNYPACREQVGQDWLAWAQAGYVDFLCPMNYTEEAHQFSRLIARQLTLTKKRIPIYPGIGATAFSSSLTPDQVVGQIAIARQAGAHGFTIFDYSSTSAASIISAVGKSAGKTPAILPHQ